MNDLARVESASMSLEKIERMAIAFHKSGLYNLKNPEQAMALMLQAQAEGRHPAIIIQEYDIILNRPALKSQAALARFQRAGGSIQWIERTPTKCSAKFFHPQGGEIVVTWDDERVKQMGLSDRDTHKKQPMIMKQWRVVAEGVRAVYPACLSGMYLAEEIQDMDPQQIKAVNEDRPMLSAPKSLSETSVASNAPMDVQVKITSDQAKRLFAVAKSAGKTEPQIRAKLSELGLDSTKDVLDGPMYDGLILWAMTVEDREPGAEG